MSAGIVWLIVVSLVGCALVAGAPDRSNWCYLGAALALGGFLAVPVGIGLGYL